MTMIHLPLKEYNEQLAKTLLTDLGTTKHYHETNDAFYLLFKNFETWEYYAKVLKKDIIEFGASYASNEETALEDFRITYCHAAVAIESLPLEIVKNQKEIQQNQDEPTVTPDMIYASKANAIEADLVDEAQDYGEFFEKQVDRWEEKTLKAIEKVDVELDKSFGEFLQQMTSAINASPFLTRVRKYIKASMTEGLEQAEEELGVQVGAGPVFNNRVKALENQQLNGYLINGKKWHGIVGATAELRLDVLRVVEDGVKAKQSRVEIARSVKEIFQGATMSQAKRITRTETTRFINEGKLSTYKQSGISGLKAWSAVPSGCCEECDFMAVKYSDGIAFDDNFVTKDNRSVPYPPLHPNCRCVIEYRTPETI